MKQKNLQPIILYPGRLSFRFEEKSKAFPDKQNLRVQHRQTSFTTNTKGTSLGCKHKRRKRPTKSKPKTIKTMVIESMAPHSSTLAWKIPWTEEPDRLQSMGSLRVGHD